jgi:lipopolysaccharide transport system ATP-binding protein
MADTVIKVEGLYKEYILGKIGYGTLQKDLASWWARLRGKEDPNSIVGREADPKLLKDNYLALRDVSFEVREGEAVGIIGKNGAGKSTLLKIISRITYPTAGAIKIRGKISSLLEVGTGFHRELSGRENIYLNGAILGMKKSVTAKRIDEIIDFAGIEKFIDTPVKRYSSGMYVRLAFSVAAHLDSDILILDEVLAVGDADFQKKCLGKMNDVATNQGRTVLFVSHNMGAVAGLCGRAILLHQGEIETTGETSEVINRYMTLHAERKGTVDLTDWKDDRTFRGPYRLKSVTLTDTSGNVKESFRFGEKIRVRTVISGTAGESFCLNVSVKSGMGTFIAEHISRNEGFYPVFKDGETTVRTEFDCILNDGTYYLQLWLGDSTRKMHDIVRNCLVFTVASGDTTVESRGMVRQPVEWDID